MFLATACRRVAVQLMEAVITRSGNRATEAVKLKLAVRVRGRVRLRVGAQERVSVLVRLTTRERTGTSPIVVDLTEKTALETVGVQDRFADSDRRVTFKRFTDGLKLRSAESVRLAARVTAGDKLTAAE
jgi:hypothetical protein